MHVHYRTGNIATHVNTERRTHGGSIKQVEDKMLLHSFKGTGTIKIGLLERV